MNQRVILYNDRDGDTHVYATAYTDDEVRRQVMLCANRHGRHAKVRSINSDQFPPQALR